MDFTQNEKISQVTHRTLVVGIDISSETHYARALIGEVWCQGYYADTAGKNTNAVRTYISERLKKDRECDQLSLFGSRDPFMGK